MLIGNKALLWTERGQPLLRDGSVYRHRLESVRPDAARLAARAGDPRFREPATSASYEYARPTRTAGETYNGATGICRDDAHLAITFCRCRNIPARYCTGYPGELGVPAVEAPMDSARSMEVFPGGPDAAGPGAGSRGAARSRYPARVKSFEHVYRLHRLMKRSRYPVPFERVMSELECSRATTKRVLAYLRDVLGAPLETSRDPRGYRYTDAAYELPGFWFSAEELQALLSLQQLLATFQPGLLDEALDPLRARLDQILRSQNLQTGEAGRIRLLRAAARPPGEHFATIAAAVLQRQRLQIDYEARGSGQLSSREVSPQRLVHYRDNWYLDAWCHKSNGLRTFAVDCVVKADALATPVQDIEEKRLDDELGGSYGIFSGTPTATAILRFTAERARWIAVEQWHPQQQGVWLPDGSYELSVPYHRDEELILDILRYGPDVEVLGPPALRAEVARRIYAALEQYRS
jgi:predicted DNA-binding transcriptional regulator YafY